MGQGHGGGADPFGAVNAKCNREGVESECTVTFDGFEVVDDGNSETSNRVEDRTGSIRASNDVTGVRQESLIIPEKNDQNAQKSNNDEIDKKLIDIFDILTSQRDFSAIT